MSKTINYRTDSNSYVYGFGHISNLVTPAVELMTEKARELGIDATFQVGGGGFLVTSGVVLVNGQHFRGMQRGTKLTFHSGWNPATRSYGAKPFKSIEQFAIILWHETLHFYFYVGNRHSSDPRCMMHANAPGWPCPGEVALMRQHWGSYTPPKPPEPEPQPDPTDQVKALQRERQQLWYERKRINERIKEIDMELDALEHAFSHQEREALTAAADVCCGAFEI